jgi:hypothetical protein
MNRAKILDELTTISTSIAYDTGALSIIEVIKQHGLVSDVKNMESLQTLGGHIQNS